MTEKQPLKLESVAQLLTEPEPPLEWLIENIWVDKSRGFIAGNPGVGKTWLALDMLISVASGQLCFGKYPVKRGAVLLVEEEASRLNLARRVHSLARARGIKDADMTTFFHLTRQTVKMPRDVAELGMFVLENDIRLVVFDSLRRFHNVNENSSSEMQDVLDSFGNLCTVTSASVVLIHHLSKGNRETDNRPVFERMRGSSDMWAWRDCVIGVEGEDESDLCKCTFQFRDAESTEPISVKRIINPISGAVSLECFGFDESVDFIETSQQIIAWMKTQYGPVTQNAVFKVVKGRKADFVKTWHTLAKKGLIEQNGHGWKPVEVPF